MGYLNPNTFSSKFDIKNDEFNVVGKHLFVLVSVPA